LILSTQTHAPVPKAVLLAMALGSADLALSAAWAVCLDTGARYAGVVTGFMNTLGNLGGFAAPLVAGFAVQRWGSWDATFAATAAIYAAGAPRGSRSIEPAAGSGPSRGRAGGGEQTPRIDARPLDSLGHAVVLRQPGDEADGLSSRRARVAGSSASSTSFVHDHQRELLPAHLVHEVAGIRIPAPSRSAMFIACRWARLAGQVRIEAVVGDEDVARRRGQTRDELVARCRSARDGR
jgi:hypothetical protein